MSRDVKTLTTRDLEFKNLWVHFLLQTSKTLVQLVKAKVFDLPHVMKGVFRLEPSNCCLAPKNLGPRMLLHGP